MLMKGPRLGGSGEDYLGPSSVESRVGTGDECQFGGCARASRIGSEIKHHITRIGRPSDGKYSHPVFFDWKGGST